MHKPFEELLSAPEFGCLDFTDVRALNCTEKQTVVKHMDTLLIAFLDAINYKHSTASQDQTLRDRIWSWAQAELEPLCKCTKETLEGILDEACACAEYYYPIASLETRYQIAKSLGAALSLDDFALTTNLRDTIIRFQYDLWGERNRGENPWASMYLDMLKGFAAYFGSKDPRVGALGVQGWTNYPEACSMEDQMAMGLPPHLAYRASDDSSHGCCPTQFPYYFRSLTGVPAPFVVSLFKPSAHAEVPMEYWVTSVVNMTTLINLLNDLFSFSQGGPNGPTLFPAMDNRPDSWTFRDTILDTMTRVYESIEELDKAFIGFAKVCDEPAASKWNVQLASEAWAGFRQGYVSWHIDRPRYKLDQVRETVSSWQ